ncbi:hypothetical protein MRX96_038039 [Rhipicephalus microplus]
MYNAVRSCCLGLTAHFAKQVSIHHFKYSDLRVGALPCLARRSLLPAVASYYEAANWRHDLLGVVYSSLCGVFGAIAPSRNEGSGSGFSDQRSCVARAACCRPLTGRISIRAPLGRSTGAMRDQSNSNSRRTSFEAVRGVRFAPLLF